MMLITLGTATGLYQAGLVAEGLVATKSIQSWELSADVAGLALTLYPVGAGVVNDRGGMTAYRAWVLAQFTVYGYVEDTADEPTDTTATDTTPPTEQPPEASN